MRGTEYGSRESDWRDDTKDAIEPDKTLPYDSPSTVAERGQLKDTTPPLIQGTIFDGTTTSGSIDLNFLGRDSRIPLAPPLQGKELQRAHVIAQVNKRERTFGQDRFGHSRD